MLKLLVYLYYNINMGVIKKRLNKEYKLTTNSKKFKAKVGTTNRLEPYVIYIIIDTWGKHVDVEGSSDVIDELNKMISIRMKKNIRTLDGFDGIILYTPNIKKTFSGDNKSFHMRFEFTMRQKEPRELKDIEEYTTHFTNEIIGEVENFKCLEYSLSKF